jgi:hypothetical protein
MALGFYFLVWKMLNPLLGYMLDSDCVAYLTLARRVAEGDYFRSLNGLWSPLNVWMLVPFIQKGMDAFEVAKLLNAVFGAILIIQFYTLSAHFKLSKAIRIGTLFTLPIIVSFMVYFQLFGDVLQLVFVLLYLSLLLNRSNHRKWYFPILCGVIMGLGFYAKAYGLLFFLLHFSVFIVLLYRERILEFKFALRQWVLGVLSILITVLPWSYALHKKYGEWTLTGMAGKLNMSWYINSGKTFKEDITLLIPPTYSDSPSFWEDPYLSQGELSTPTSSVTHFVKWVARVVHTTLIAVGCFSEISTLSIALLFFGWYYFFFKRRNTVLDNAFQYKLLILTITLLPLGYLMMHIETRYIWLNLFLLLILLGFVIDRYRDYVTSAKMYIVLSGLALATFFVFPIVQVEQLKYKNKELFAMADELRQHQFQGKFTGNMTDAGRMWVVAYLTKSSFFTIERTDYSLDELKLEMARYQVDYYFMDMENNVFPNLHLDADFTPFLKVGGIQIFKFAGVRKSLP